MALKKGFKIFLFTGIGLSVIGIIIAFSAYRMLFGPNVKITSDTTTYLFIEPDSDYDKVYSELEKYLTNKRSFKWFSNIKEYPEHVKPGRYALENGMSSYILVNKLISGNQEPVRVTFNNVTFPKDIPAKVERYFYFDSVALHKHLANDEYWITKGIDKKNRIAYFLPNTYEMYWNYTPEQFTDRMIDEYNKFWNDERKAKAEAMNLTPAEVSVLASIVQKETIHMDEISKMAGVYVNRMRIGMKLQADPTVKFAVGLPGLRRVLYRHLEHPSPYNTYYVEGLPPGPICAAEPGVIDRVLDYEKHEYLFYCAKPGYRTHHAFAKTKAQHDRNAAKYKQWLRQEGIR